MEEADKVTVSGPLLDPVAPDTLPEERRAHPRFAVDEDSVLLIVNHGLSLDCRILELSLSGCRLCTLQPFALAEHLRVEVTFKVNGVGFRFLGLIQWTDNQHLIGIRFIEAVARRTEQLAEVLAEIEAVAREREAQEAAGIASAKTPVDEQARKLAEAEERQWAEIQRIARKAKVQHAAIQQPEHERRDQTRHEIDAVAIIVLVKSGTRLKGRIIDLSIGGCRIRSEQPFPLGIYTRVETEFHFGGMPFLLAGVIQDIHDTHTVAIRFLDVSARKQEQIEQLIVELEEIEALRSVAPVSPDNAQDA